LPTQIKSNKGFISSIGQVRTKVIRLAICITKNYLKIVQSKNDNEAKGILITNCKKVGLQGDK